MHFHDQLTEREHTVMVLVMKGLRNKQIAERLVLSVYTVQEHLKHIYGKLGAQNRADAVRRYLQRHP